MTQTQVAGTTGQEPAAPPEHVQLEYWQRALAGLPDELALPGSTTGHPATTRQWVAIARPGGLRGAPVGWFRHLGGPRTPALSLSRGFRSAANRVVAAKSSERRSFGWRRRRR